MKQTQNKEKTKRKDIFIASGSYRQVYQTDESTCIKVMKPLKEKRYGPFTVSYPMNVYTLFKFDISDFNSYESDNYQKYFSGVNGTLNGCFARIFGVKGDVLHAHCHK